MGVGVCVGGTGEGDGAVVAVAGTAVGMLVIEMGVPDVAHPASTSTITDNKANKGNLLFMYSSFYLWQFLFALLPIQPGSENDLGASWLAPAPVGLFLPRKPVINIRNRIHRAIAR